MATITRPKDGSKSYKYPDPFYTGFRHGEDGIGFNVEAFPSVTDYVSYKNGYISGRRYYRQVMGYWLSTGCPVWDSTEQLVTEVS
jgi:hypothetical protein